MSIPPLVCSTPPPPDQCEEDKDPDDFDIHYNLSQDEDDDDENNDYDYGSYSTFNNFQTHSYNEKDNTSVLTNEQDSTSEKENIHTTTKTSTESSMELKNNQFEESVIGTSQHSKTDMHQENGSKCDEDNNIEDLDLKLEECITASIKINTEDNNTKEYDVNTMVKEENVVISNIDIDGGNEDIHGTVLENHHELKLSSNQENEIVPINDDIPNVYDSNDDIIFPEVNKSHTEFNKCIKEVETVSHDDFEDFDDFQFSSPAIKSNIINDNFDNPWETVDEENNQFGDFAANFDQIQKDSSENNITESSVNITAHKFEDLKLDDVSQNIAVDDDDFGDFDDFKSSIVSNVMNTDVSHEQQIDMCQEVSVLNLELSDKGNQFLDSVNQVLNSIFLEDLEKPTSEYEFKLDSMLSETWRHLIETDVRQPYIVNWNNSLGQKTLLRALCIDSRNILFGPKWSYSMPKYAVTLSNAPLQPQKPALHSSTSQNETVSSEIIPNKMGTWSDPFTSDGQESCNTENEVARIDGNSVQVEVIDNSAPSKSENIYSSNLSVQPLRQINLPDTHIFTPTDSETPRSKTIHYDTGHTVLLQEKSNNSNAFHSKNSIVEPEARLKTCSSKDSEYWEFQDFKSTLLKSSMTTLDTTSEAMPVQEISSSSNHQKKLNQTYQGELLKPIKITPIVPKLNWPDPGEVKEVFDDFTDFVSNSSWSKETSSVQMSCNGPVTECTLVYNTCEKINDTKTNETEAIKPSLTNNSIDDEFDTFQYALPAQHINEIPNTINSYTVKSSNIQYFPSKSQVVNQKPNFEEAFSTFNFNMTDAVSSTNQSKPDQPSSLPLPRNMLSMSNATEVTSGKLTPQFTTLSQSIILQPIPANTNIQTHQKTGQILQPLSLESYSQLNWPSPGIDLQDLSKFNPVETVHTLKSDLSSNSLNKNSSSPIHHQKTSTTNQAADDEVWGEFISSKPRTQSSTQKKIPNFGEDDEWTDFVSSPSVKPQNGLNTISFNVHTNSNMLKNTYQNKLAKNSQSIDIPTLNYITPKTNIPKTCNDRHFQNL